MGCRALPIQNVQEIINNVGAPKILKEDADVHVQTNTIETEINAPHVHIHVWRVMDKTRCRARCVHLERSSSTQMVRKQEHAVKAARQMMSVTLAA